MVNANPILSNDATDEITNHYNSIGGLLDADGKLALNGRSDDLVALTLFNLSRPKDK